MRKTKNKEFAFTKLLVCGMCGSGITAQEKFKNLVDGSVSKYIYYGCTRGKDRSCKSIYIKEENLLKELLKIMDEVEIDQIGMRAKLEEEVERFNKFQTSILGGDKNKEVETKKIDVRSYSKYLLQNGSISEKRDLLMLLRSKLVYKDKKITLT